MDSVWLSVCIIAAVGIAAFIGLWWLARVARRERETPEASPHQKP